MRKVYIILLLLPLIIPFSCKQKDVYENAGSEIPDYEAPLPGDKGTIYPSGITHSGVTLSWIKAKDDRTPQNQLLYSVYISANPDIETVSDAEQNGTLLQDWITDYDSLEISNLDEASPYYFNVIVEDLAENKSAYTMLEISTADITLPVPGDCGAISISEILTGSITLSWSEASDNSTEQNELAYRVYYSLEDNIDTVAAAEANGTMAADWATGLTLHQVAGLYINTVYYFNIIAMDSSGNKSAYTPVMQKTNSNAPVPGDSGTISEDSKTAFSITLNWEVADDDFTSAGELEYCVYRSDYPDIDTVAGAELNGLPIQNWTADYTSHQATGLNEATTYYFNVIVRDSDLNKAAYIMIDETTDDLTPPSPGNSGNLITSNIQTDSITVQWTEATDNGTDQEDLSYRAFYSTSNNITTVASAEANGTPVIDWTQDISSVQVEGLSESTTYYINVLVRDASDNKAAYTSRSETTASSGSPVPGNDGIIVTSGISSSGLTLTWDIAADDSTPASDLQYIVYQSGLPDIDTVANAEANGTVADGCTWNYDYTTFDITGLDEASTYYFNVLVRDTANNKSAYTMVEAATSDISPPVPGNSGQITASDIGPLSLKLSWIEAADNNDPQEELRYRVFKSLSNNIGTVSLAEANGEPASDWTEDISSYEIKGLAPGTTYFFNVLVMDTPENKNAYQMVSASTQAGDNSIYMFTAGLHSGNLGGRAGADLFCESVNGEIKSSGCTNIRAFISVNENDEIRDMPELYGIPTDRPIKGYTGLVVANNWTELITSNITRSLFNANIIIPEGKQWWSGSDQDGAVYLGTERTCGEWSTNDPMSRGRTGINNTTQHSDPGWISYATDMCNKQYFIVCICW